jgi:FKBP-type peptidyl-prolyl cis-trans isomerase FklB
LSGGLRQYLQPEGEATMLTWTTILTAAVAVAGSASILLAAEGQPSTAATPTPSATSTPTTGATSTATPTAGATSTSTGTSATGSAFKTPKEAISYGFGVTIARNFKRSNVDMDVDLLLRGIRDEMTGAKLAMTEEELQVAGRDFQAEARRKQSEAAAAEGDKNRKEGEAFLAANKTKEGVVTLPSGLQYKILKAGEGKKPAATDTVEVNYRGTLVNGTEFDSSYKRGQSTTFPVGQVIPGWTEALKLMPVGSKWQLFIPSDLAYGPRAMGQTIGPNSTLVFEVELIGIK